MTIQSYKLGAGTLILDTTEDVSAQVTKLVVKATENVTKSDAINVLSGEQLAGDEEATYSHSLEGTVLQDIGADSFVEWTWANQGEVVGWEFVPSTAAGRQASGTVRIVPLDIGGDVKARNTADFTWSVPEKPTIGAA